MSLIIAHRYRVGQQLYPFSQGDLFLAYDVQLFRSVNIWLLPTARMSVVALFMEQIEKVANVGTEYIPEVWDRGVDVISRTPYIVFEPFACMPLSTMLDQSERLPLSQSISLGLIILRALKIFHASGIIHGRVNYHNIVRCNDRLKIIGFGLQYLQPVNALPGDLTSFLSPNQLRGGAASDLCDIHAVGVLIHKMMTGRLLVLPPKAEGAVQTVIESRIASDYNELNIQVKPELLGAISRLFSGEYSDQFQSAEQAVATISTIDFVN